MALRMWGQTIIQAATPGEDPVVVGTLWVDTTGTASLKVCTSVAPYVFSTVTGSGGGALDDLSDVVITAAATGDYLRYNGSNWVDVASGQIVTDINAALDHGVLAGLSDDDHTIYLLASAATNRATFASNWTDLTDAGASTLHKHDHGGQDGLADDDHTQYALLTGRGGQVLLDTELRDHSESKATGTISTNTLAVDYTTAAVFSVSLNAAITTFTIANPPASGEHAAVTFVFTADGTVRAITWPSGTVWPAGVAPTMTGTNGKRDIITLVTFDAGTTWFGMIVGQNY